MDIVKAKKYESVIIETSYFPCIEYFVCMNEAEQILIEAHEHFVKQTYRNRCYIKSANKVDCLTVPVKKNKKEIREVEIDYSQRWVKDHWGAIVSSYGKAPFFEYFIDDLEQILFKKERFLFDLNLKLMTNCLEALGMKKEIILTKSYDKNVEKGIFDVRSRINPKTNFNKRGFYKAYQYNQIFGKDFVVNLSILDLLFCEGPNAMTILKLSKNENLNN